jgi:D-3-phosphoglycerate dehydrogenase
MDNIDVDYAKSKGIQVINTPASSSESVAELMLTCFQVFVSYMIRTEICLKVILILTVWKAYANGVELRGKTLGIVGIGRIGQATAKMALGLGMKVIAADSFIPKVDVK